MIGLSRFMQICGLALISGALGPAASSGRAERNPTSPPTRCEVSFPISVELIPLNAPDLARPTRFQVQVDSNLDPDLVRDMQLLYELPPRLRLQAQAGSQPPVLRKTGRSTLELGIILPDTARYPIRARLVVHLANGRTISQTAVAWTGLTAEGTPEGLIGRLIDRDGTGIRIYQGDSLKESR